MLSKPSPTPLSHSDGTPNSKRTRLVVCLTIYGGTLGGAALLVNLLSRTKFPKEPEHLSLTSTIFLSGGAIIVGGILAGVITYWVSNNTDKARGLLMWAFLGFAFGVLSPFFTGMIIPLSTVFLNLAMNVITAGEVLPQVLNSILRAPAFAFTHGVLGLFTGLLAGTLFGAGSWLIDMANSSSNRWLSTYGTYVIALGLSIAAFGIAAFGPPSTLAKLG